MESYWIGVCITLCSLSTQGPVALACPVGTGLRLWSQEVLGILESLAVGDEEIRFVSSDKRVKRTRSMIEYVIESGR